MTITPIDRTLYKAYKEDIIKEMASNEHSNFNLAKQLAALLGPPNHQDYEKNDFYNGAIERYFHLYSYDLKDDVKAAIERLRHLIKFDKWEPQLPEDINKSLELNHRDCNKYYHENLIIDISNVSNILPQNSIKFNIDQSFNRLHLPICVFLKNKEYRLQSMIAEIEKYNREKEIEVKGINQGNGHECLYGLSLKHKGTWPNEKVPNKTVTFYKSTLRRYCSYFIIANSKVFDVGGNSGWEKIETTEIALKHYGKDYPHTITKDCIEHLLIFDNYQSQVPQKEVNRQGGA